MNNYTAWLNGQSVATGTLREVDLKAREIANTERWKTFETETTLKITRGPKQFFVKAVKL